MKVLVLGISDFSYLAQNTYKAFKNKYTNVKFFNVKKYKKATKYINKNLDIYFFRNNIKQFKPNLIFIVAPYFIKKEYFEVIEEFKNENKYQVFGWIGDLFNHSDTNNYISNTIDKKFITDSHFKTLYQNNDNVSYLPLATEPSLFINTNRSKKFFSMFVASSTKYRSELVSKVEFPLTIYGTGWENLKKTNDNINLDINDKKIDFKKTLKLYTESKSVLNLKNEMNVVNGLNQRTFDPYISDTLVFQDYSKDLELCFDLDKEIIIFNDILELNEKVNRFKKDTTHFDRILENGKKRVLSEHTFAHRIETIMKDFG